MNKFGLFIFGILMAVFLSIAAMGAWNLLYGIDRKHDKAKFFRQWRKRQVQMEKQK